MTDRPPIIGLAGGIGAGKSAVAACLQALGCVVSDSDELAKAALRDHAVVEQLVARWGARVIGRDGLVNRSAVAAIVFEDERERRWLESIVHPWIEARRRASFAAAPPGTPALVIDAPLLFEAGLDRDCDGILFVDAPRALRLERLRASRGWSASELDRREAAQLPLDLKRAKADIVIVNTGDRQRLHQDARAALDTLVSKHARG